MIEIMDEHWWCTRDPFLPVVKKPVPERKDVKKSSSRHTLVATMSALIETTERREESKRQTAEMDNDDSGSPERKPSSTNLSDASAQVYSYLMIANRLDYWTPPRAITRIHIFLRSNFFFVSEWLSMTRPGVLISSSPEDDTKKDRVRPVCLKGTNGWNYAFGKNRIPERGEHKFGFEVLSSPTSMPKFSDFSIGICAVPLAQFTHDHELKPTFPGTLGYDRPYKPCWGLMWMARDIYFDSMKGHFIRFGDSLGENPASCSGDKEKEGKYPDDRKFHLQDAHPKVGDVLQVSVDLQNRRIAFWHNDRCLRVLHIPKKPSVGFVPVISVYWKNSSVRTPPKQFTPNFARSSIPTVRRDSGDVDA